VYLGMWVFPWDIVDEDIETVLKRIRDEAGVNAVSLAVSYDAAKFLMPRNPKRKVYFSEEGVVYFQPMPAWYAGLELQPKVSSICKERNLLAELMRVAEKAEMKVVAWVTCCHNTRLASQRRDCATVNCFGDVYVTHLCPSNYSVREFLLAMLGDIVTNYKPYAVELEALEYMPFHHAYHHEKIDIDLPPLIEFLLGLCFCSSCMKRAQDDGIDAVGVRNTVRREIERYFSSPSSFTREQVTWEMLTHMLSEEVIGYIQMRIASMSSLLELIHNSIKHRSHTKIHLFGAIRPGSLWQTGLEPSLLSQYADSVIVLVYRLSTDELRTSLIVNRAMMKERMLIIGLHPSEKYSESFERFAERIQICVDSGVDGFSFFSYSVLMPHHFNWIKRALSQAGILK